MKIHPLLEQYGLVTKNLYHRAKNRYISAEALDIFCRTFPDADKRLGALPYNWVKDIAKEEIPALTIRCDEAFKNFSSEVAEITEKVTGYFNYKNFDKSIEKLTNILKTLLKRDDISISYVGHGRIKHCHKIQVGDYSYALSTYMHPDKLELMFANYFNGYHGRGEESQNIFMRYKRGSHGRTARPFMSRVSDKTEKTGGYILSKFIESDHSEKIPLGKWQTRRQFIRDEDAHNTKNGISIEAGGCKANSCYISNPQLRANWSSFAKILDELSGPVNITRLEQKSVIDLLSKARENNIDILDKEFLASIDFLPENHLKFVKKIIKRVKTLRKLRNRLEKQGKYEPVKELLKKDFEAMYPENFYAKKISENEEYILMTHDYNPIHIFNMHNFLISELGIEPVSKYPIWYSTNRFNNATMY